MIELGRVSIRLFGVEIRWYALLIISGMLIGLAVARLREERLGLPKETSLDLALCGIPAALLGARLYYVLFEWRNFVRGPWWRIFAVWEGGLAIYGGIIGALLAGWAYAKSNSLPYRRLLDLAAPCFALGQAVGRWGNFVNQEAHGGLVTLPALRFFPVSVEIGGEWYYATFFYESVWCLIVAAVILLLEHRRLLRRSGDGFMVYVLLYALERAVVEGMRTDSLYIGPVRVSQALSLLAALAVTVIWVRRAARAPLVLRALAPACAALIFVPAALGRGFGTLAAAALTVVFSAALYFRTDPINDPIQNRGEGL